MIDFLNTQSLLDIGFNIQILPNSLLLITLQYSIDLSDPKKVEDSEETLMNLDALTSEVIRCGGTVSAKDRSTLDQISPYLYERMAGRAGCQL